MKNRLAMAALAMGLAASMPGSYGPVDTAWSSPSLPSYRPRLTGSKAKHRDRNRRRNRIARQSRRENRK